MSRKIIGITVGTPLPKPNFDQTDPSKGDYIKGKRSFVVYDQEQDLTEEQRAQALTNLGVVMQDTEPTNVETGMLWFDTSSMGSADGIVSGGNLPETSSPHQQLITDENGEAKWAERTHYTELVEGVVLEETTLTADESGQCFLTEPLAITPAKGYDYTVVYNGVSYECVGVSFDTDGIEMVALGNLAATGSGDDTGEPFAIAIPPEGLTIDGITVYAIIFALDGSTEITLSITGVSEIIHPLDEKYLSIPNSYLKNGKAAGSLRGVGSSTEDDTYSLGTGAFSIGQWTQAPGDYSYAEGNNTTANGEYSHAQGTGSEASGVASHAGGSGTIASGDYSHAEGNATIAASEAQHAEGRYNIKDDAGTYAHIIGNGTYNKSSNAYALDWDGNAWFSGDVYVGSTSGTNKDEGSKKLATEEYVESAMAAQQEGLKGLISDITPSNVLDALLNGATVLIGGQDPENQSHLYLFSSFSCMSYGDGYTVVGSYTADIENTTSVTQIIGDTTDNTWSFSTIEIAKKGDIPEAGYIPVKGTDYWTEQDKAEIKAYVDEAILGGEW